MKTPEATLKAFLKGWKNHNEKQTQLHTTKTWQSTNSKDSFAVKDLESFEIVSKVQNTCHADFKVLLNCQLIQCRLVCERAPYRTSAKPQDQSDIDLCKSFGISANVAWGVNPVSFKPVK